ncbi:hypothetical protein swp_3044 [Shewanella piezotolerans WP3]|uniref:Uncharacterized protein n=1 Tax=Shewanella piezotolerans (strain WP3 / JCM 13877) TaxID=225849 RepID=B8CR90_SHEPW|nr:hypothetical protein swp_3044 [Shewanella piezotolerans WP3]
MLDDDFLYTFFDVAHCFLSYSNYALAQDFE